MSGLTTKQVGLWLLKFARALEAMIIVALRAYLLQMLAGYKPMYTWIANLISEEIANRIGRCCGLGQAQNMILVRGKMN